MLRQVYTGPLGLAALVTLANAAKPVTVDDTAYLIYARHIFSHPLDPYGFPIFWYAAPEPALEVLAPPVVPYWLALGLRLFGEHIVLLKLWLFPFAWLLAWSLNALFVRFARGLERLAVPLVMLSPAVLPAVNLMLDVPAVALALASVELFIRASCRVGTTHQTSNTVGGAHPTKVPAPTGSWRLALGAGLVAALAMQTKYTAVVAPAAMVWFAFTHRRLGLGVAAAAVAATAFAAWEAWLVAQYGRSHFWANAMAASPGEGNLAGSLRAKLELLPMLAGHLGALAVGAGLLAASALRVPRRWLAVAAGVWGAGFVLVATLPRRWTLVTHDLSAATAFWQLTGALWLFAGLACAGVLLFRFKKGLSVRPNAGTLFLVGWLLIEVGVAVAITPFPAARRVIGVTVVLALLAARASSRVGRLHPTRRAPRWLLPLTVAAGVAVAGIDTLDAFPEKWCAERAAEVTRDREPTSTVWFVGHWGFQHYCEREGMQPLVARQTTARAGDFLVIPVYPNEPGFHRPYAGFPVVHPPSSVAEPVAEVWWDDRLAAKTVPNFYGGLDPVAGRDHPRLRVRVYHLKEDWVMPGK